MMTATSCTHKHLCYTDAQRMTHALSSALHYYSKLSMATSNIVAVLGAAQCCSAELRECAIHQKQGNINAACHLNLSPS